MRGDEMGNPGPRDRRLDLSKEALVFVAVVLVGSALLLATVRGVQERRVAQMLEVIRPGMTEQQVRAAIGEPDNVFGIDQQERWYGHGTFDPTRDIPGTDHVMQYRVLTRAFTVHIDQRGKVLGATASYL